jgi:Uma2 family endonuclease
VTSALPLHQYTFDQYVLLEQNGTTRHEFLEGEIYAMAGGTPEHAALAAAVGHQLSERLEGGRCRVYSSDLNVRVVETGLATYPDVTVVCGPSHRDPESRNTVTNPKVVVEVTSDSTERYDRGKKLEQYMQGPTIEAVVLVSHRSHLVEVWTRSESGWGHTQAAAGDHAAIAPIGCSLDVDRLYAAVKEAAG